MFEDDTLTLLMLVWKPTKGQLANSADPDKKPQNVASDHGLHSLH